MNPQGSGASNRATKGGRSQVFQAADAILREGRRPTVDAIRESLGGGSQTTLVAHLNDWYRELGLRIAAAEVPLAGLPAEASQLLQQLWRVASKAGHSGGPDASAHADIAQRMREAELEGLVAQNKALEILNGELKTQRRNIEGLLTDTRAMLTRREAELGEERLSRSEAEQALARAMLDIEVLRARQATRLSTRPALQVAKRRRASRTPSPGRKAKAARDRKPARPVKSTRRKTLRARPIRSPSAGKTRKKRRIRK